MMSDVLGNILSRGDRSGGWREAVNVGRGRLDDRVVGAEWEGG